MNVMEGIKNIFDDDELISILAGLVRTRTQNPIETENEAAIFVKDILSRNGIEAELDPVCNGRANVLARINGGSPGPVLIYNGHLDVVPAGDGWHYPPFSAVIKDGKMYGRGTADMKSGIAAMIYAAILLKRLARTFAGELVLFFDVDEERENMGIKHYLQKEWHADYAVVGEPTDLNICIGHKGVARYRLRTRGTLAHTCAEENPDNAIYKMVKLVSGLEQLGHYVRKKSHPVIGNASLTVSQINGGKAPNMVPDACEIQIDRRTLYGEEPVEVANEINELLQSYVNGKIGFELEQYLFLHSSYIDPGHPLIKSMKEAVLKVRKVEPLVKTFNASCEASFFSRGKGIPTAIFGPGNLEMAHAVDESVEIKQVIEAAHVYFELAAGMLRQVY